MNPIIKYLRETAKKDPKRIVFPEASDERIISATKYIRKQGIAEPLLLTPKNIDPKKKKVFADYLFKNRKSNALSQAEASELLDRRIYYAAMMARCQEADGFVAGAQYTTSAVIKAAIRCLEVDRKSGIISSCFVMAVPGCSYGEKGVLIFADCGVIPLPSAEQLASIAVSSAQFVKDVLAITPRVAFLSFSTKGSARNKWTNKVREAVELAKSKNQELLVDGELQADSALVPEVAAKKLKDSQVAGRANVLIFPSLDSGNIAYKLVQRLAKARAIGPLVLGTKQPCSDLSRGCSVDDIIDAVAVTVIRAQKRNQ